MASETYGSSPLWHRIRNLDLTSSYEQYDEMNDNSIDANATKVIKAFCIKDDSCALIHIDNGKGMEYPSHIIDPENMKAKNDQEIGKNHVGAFQTIFSSEANLVYIYSKIRNNPWKMTRINIDKINKNLEKYDNGDIESNRLTSRINSLIKKDIENDDDASDDVFEFEPITKFLNDDLFQLIKEMDSGTVILFDYKKNNCPFYDSENEEEKYDENEESKNDTFVERYAKRCSYTYDSETLEKFQIIKNNIPIKIENADYLCIKNGYIPLIINCYYFEDKCVFEFENQTIGWKHTSRFSRITSDKYSDYKTNNKWKKFDIKITVLSNTDSEEQINALQLPSRARARFPRINIIFGSNENKNIRTIGIPHITYPKEYLKGTKYLKLEPFGLRCVFELDSNNLRDFGIKNNKSNPNLDNLENKYFKIPFEKVVYPILDLGCKIEKLKTNKGLHEQKSARTLTGEKLYNNGIKNEKDWMVENIKKCLQLEYNENTIKNFKYPIDVLKTLQLSIKNAIDMKNKLELDEEEEEDDEESYSDNDINNDSEDEGDNDESDNKEYDNNEDENEEEDEFGVVESDDDDLEFDDSDSDANEESKNENTMTKPRTNNNNIKIKLDNIKANLDKLNNKDIQKIYKTYSNNFHKNKTNTDCKISELKEALPYFISQLKLCITRTGNINSKKIIENIYNKTK